MSDNHASSIHGQFVLIPGQCVAFSLSVPPRDDMGCPADVLPYWFRQTVRCRPNPGGGSAALPKIAELQVDLWSLLQKIRPDFDLATPSLKEAWDEEMDFSSLSTGWN